MSQIITETTDADQSKPISVSSGDLVTFALTGTYGATEYADVQYTDDGGSTWSDLYQDGSQVRLSTVNNMVTVYGPGIFRVDKDATSASAGVRRFS